MLDAAAQRARQQRKREKDAADAAYFAGPPQSIAPWDHWAYAKWKQRADRRRAIRLPGVQARRAERDIERAKAREQRDAAVGAAKQHYDSCRAAESRIRKDRPPCRCKGPVVHFNRDGSTSLIYPTYDAAALAEEEAAEQRHFAHEADARQQRENALEALRAARRQPLRPVRTDAEVAESEGWCCSVGRGLHQAFCISP